MESKTVWNALDASPEIAWESPLEKDVFHYPAGSVNVEPPKFNPESQFCAWDGSKWVVSKIPQPTVLEAPKKPILPEQEPEDEITPDPDPEPYVETYADKRLKEYGFVFEQLEFITENGIEAWQSRVAEIKKKFPKP